MYCFLAQISYCQFRSHPVYFLSLPRDCVNLFNNILYLNISLVYITLVISKDYTNDLNTYYIRVFVANGCKAEYFKDAHIFSFYEHVTLQLILVFFLVKVRYVMPYDCTTSG